MKCCIGEKINQCQWDGKTKQSTKQGKIERDSHHGLQDDLLSGLG